MNTVPIPEGMDTRVFVMESGAVRHVPETVRTFFPGCRPMVIADGNTWEAAGEKVRSLLIQAGMKPYEPFLFPGEPRLHPTDANYEKLAAAFPEDICPVAVGSGVINDLVKVASGIRKKHYLCVPTACSVDGYTSAGGAMAVGGRKITVPCPPPYAVVADTDVLASAPEEMLASGYADLLTKMPAGADWIIAETLGIEPIDPKIWDLVQKELRDRLSDGHDMGKVFMGLAATGYSMQLYHDSRPASGAEHMLSHVLEMEGVLYHGEEVSHGFKVAVGTMEVMHLMEFILRTSREEAEKMASPLPTRKQREEEIAALLVKGCYGSGIPETALGKFQEGEAGLLRRKLIFEKWDTIRERIRKQLYSMDTIRQMLVQAGAPVTASAIGLGKEQFLHAVRTSQLIRKRYVVTDLLYEAGLFEQAIATLDDMF